MSKKLSGKVALVTGASKGIGAAIAKDLAAEGASIVVNYASSAAGAEQVVNDIVAAGGTAVAIQADLSKREEITQLFNRTIEAYGRLDILVNNAGIYEFSPLESVTEDLFHRQFDLNVLGLILASKEAAQYFSDGGSIINISSLVSTASIANVSVYGATKGAVDALTRSLAKELGPRNIRVNSINPGMVETEGVQSAGFLESDLRGYLESNTPLGRIGRPDDISPVAVFLASNDSKWITGETLVVAGGLS